MNSYTIKIVNESGAVQHYKLFNDTPKISGGVSPEIWNNVFQTADYIQPNAVAEFTVWKTYYGTVGTIKGSQAAGAMVQVSQILPVTLGIREDNGTVTAGTTLTMGVAGGIQPFFKQDNTVMESYANCFAIETEPTFTVDDAKACNMMIGLATSKGGGSGSPTATFMPEPGCTYEIQPKNSYWVTFGKGFKAGQLADVAKIGNKCEVDFTRLPRVVTLRHTPQGRLVVQVGGGNEWGTDN